MSEEAIVHVTHGPYADQRIRMSKTDAAAAVNEGWAVDPNKPVDLEKEPKQISNEERAKIIERAHHAVSKLRGDDETKTMKPREEGHYETRDVKPHAGKAK